MTGLWRIRVWRIGRPGVGCQRHEARLAVGDNEIHRAQQQTIRKRAPVGQVHVEQCVLDAKMAGKGLLSTGNLERHVQ